MAGKPGSSDPFELEQVEPERNERERNLNVSNNKAPRLLNLPPTPGESADNNECGGGCSMLPQPVSSFFRCQNPSNVVDQRVDDRMGGDQDALGFSSEWNEVLVVQEPCMTASVTTRSKMDEYRKNIAAINVKLHDAQKRLKNLQGMARDRAGDETPSIASPPVEGSPVEPRTSHSSGGSLAFSEKMSNDMGIAEIVHEEEIAGDTWEEAPSERMNVRTSATFNEAMMAHQDVHLADKTAEAMVMGSALGYPRIVEILIFAIALGGVVFTLIAESEQLGVTDDAGHRRLAAATPPLVKDIIWSVAVAGIIAMIAYGLYLPLVLGYMLGGFIVGPVGFDIVIGGPAMTDVTRLGVLFVLFMMGLELDVVTLVFSYRKYMVLGFFTVPICTGAMYGIFSALDSASVSFGTGEHTILYCAVCSSFSSLALVLNILTRKNQMEALSSILTNGILMTQALWSIVAFLFQPHLDGTDAGEVFKTIGWLVVLAVAAYIYARVIMPSVLHSAESSIELLLVVSLSWCFFVASIGLLPFIELPMEVSALISGIALACFPYSTGFTQKIKYIRDFFLTLFFAGLGAEMPAPTGDIVGKAFLVAGLVLVVRWLCIFCVSAPTRGGRSAVLATLNLSQIGELSLILLTIGKLYKHIDEDTQAIFVFAFVILAIISSLFIWEGENVYRFFERSTKRTNSGQLVRTVSKEAYGDSREVVLLGFSKVSHMLFAQLKAEEAEILRHLHLIHPDPKEDLKKTFAAVGIKFTNADFGAAEVLSTSQEQPPDLAICTIPGSMLEQISIKNADLIKTVKDVWPECMVVVTEESPHAAQAAYEAGADYVVRMAKLCAGRLVELIAEEATSMHHHEIQQRFSKKDTDKRGGSVFWQDEGTGSTWW